MELEFEQTLAPEYVAHLTLKVSQAIAVELHDNPALELVEVPTCRVCGTEMHGSICPHCIQRQKMGSQTSGADHGVEDVPVRARDREPVPD